MPLHDIHYKHWTGQSTGIWTRRGVIAQHGLSACLQNRAIRTLVIVCQGFGLGMVAALFIVGQLLVPDSFVVRSIAQLNPALQTFAGMLTLWLREHPEISVRATQNVLLYYGCTILTPVSIFVLGMAMPILITRDLASSAIVIYSSKALTRVDYLLGKFCVAFGLLSIIWLAPLCGAWFIGNLVAPDWGYFWHSRPAFLHVLTYGLCAMTILSGLAMGVSALSSKEKATPALWLIWWVVGMVIEQIAIKTKPWLCHISFSYDLRELRLAIFRLGGDVTTAQQNIPVLGDMLKNIPQHVMDELTDPAVWGSVLALSVMLAGAWIIIQKRVKPE